MEDEEEEEEGGQQSTTDSACEEEDEDEEEEEESREGTGGGVRTSSHPCPCSSSPSTSSTTLRLPPSPSAAHEAGAVIRAMVRTSKAAMLLLKPHRHLDVVELVHAEIFGQTMMPLDRMHTLAVPLIEVLHHQSP